jgi:hypothetical protein
MDFHSTFNVENQLIGVEGVKTPAGERDREDPQAQPRRLPAPRGKRSAWNGNQPLNENKKLQADPISIEFVYSLKQGFPSF